MMGGIRTVEEELARFNATHAGRAVPIDVQARFYARVGWLELAGLVPPDDFNGIHLTYGNEIDLEGTDELTRQIGGPSEDLS